MDIEIQCKAKTILIIMKAALIIADIILPDLERISGLLCQYVSLILAYCGAIFSSNFEEFKLLRTHF
jgi:hypothetical protein